MGLIELKGKNMSSDFQHIRQNADIYDHFNDELISLTGTDVIDNLMERRTHKAPEWNQRMPLSSANPYIRHDIINANSIAKLMGEDIFL